MMAKLSWPLLSLPFHKTVMLFFGVFARVNFSRAVSSPELFRLPAGASCWIAFVLLFWGAIGCDVNSALERVSQARHLSADLLVQFTKAVI